MVQPGNSFYEAARALLSALGAPQTPENINALVAWMWCEKPHPDGAWQWNNPLNTTLACCNWVRNVNQVGVKEYPTKADGIEATVRTLQRPYYPTLLAALRSGDVGAFLNAVNEIRTWGTNPDCIRSTYYSLPPPPAPPQGGVVVIGLPLWERAVKYASVAAIIAGCALIGYGFARGKKAS